MGAVFLWQAFEGPVGGDVLGRDGTRGGAEPDARQRQHHVALVALPVCRSARRDGSLPGHAETDSSSSISARRSGAGKGALRVTSRSMSLCGLSPPSSAEPNR